MRCQLLPLLELEELEVGGPSPPQELLTLLTLGLNLRKIILGSSCQPTDSIMLQVDLFI